MNQQNAHLPEYFHPVLQSTLFKTSSHAFQSTFSIVTDVYRVVPLKLLHVRNNIQIVIIQSIAGYSKQIQRRERLWDVVSARRPGMELEIARLGIFLTGYLSHICEGGLMVVLRL